MILRTLLKTLLLISTAALFWGCASGPTTNSSRYPVTHSGAIQKVEDGTVVGVRQVKIDGVATNMGRLVGAGIGGAVGALAVPIKTQTVQDVSISAPTPDTVNITGTTTGTSNRHENQAAMAVGGAVGMVVGQKVEKALSAKKAQELTIALDSGETVLVVQIYREPAFYEDERVKLCTTRTGDSVVYHAGEDPTLDPDTNAYLVTDPEAETEEFEPVTW